MTTELARYTDDQVSLLKQQVAVGCSDGELQYFLEFCRSKQLDPFARQVYAIKRGGGKMTIQTGIDGFRSIANRTNTYAPGDESWAINAENLVVSATVSVRKLVAGSWITFSATAFWDVYAVATNPIWQKMPRTMLAKCAEAKALRKGWPDELGGLYEGAEMDQASRLPSSTIISASMPGNGDVLDKPKTPATLPDIPERFDTMPEELCAMVPALRKISNEFIQKLPQEDLTLALGVVAKKASAAKSDHNRAYLSALYSQLEEEQVLRDTNQNEKEAGDAKE